MEHSQDTTKENNKEGMSIIAVSKYQSKKVPSLTRCECIKKIREEGHLVCPERTHQYSLCS